MLTVNKIVDLTKGTLLGSAGLNPSITGFSIDSRTLKPGNVFVALQGDQFHGNVFAPSAVENGAVAIITDKPLSHKTIPVIQVDNSLTALQNIAEHQRSVFKGTVCCVTGTVGKTGVKEALGYLLRQLGYNVHISQKSYNNHIGVPLTLTNLLDPLTTHAIVEIGTNHPGEILPLTQMANPTLALVTAVGPGHIEFFNSVEDIALEKASIYSGLVPKGIAILPKDSEYYDRMKQVALKNTSCSSISFGQDQTAEISLVSADLLTEKHHIRVSARIGDTKVSYTLPTIHYGWVNNSLAVLAVIYAMGLDVMAAASHFETLPLVDGRGQVHHITVKGKLIRLIDDAYNANPLSMKAALETLARYPGRKLAVIGDMRELGHFSEHYHRQMGQLCQTLSIDKVIACGQHMEHAFQELQPEQQLALVEGYQDVLAVLTEHLKDVDVILLKASNGVKLHCVVSDLLKMAMTLPPESL